MTRPLRWLTPHMIGIGLGIASTMPAIASCARQGESTTAETRPAHTPAPHASRPLPADATPIEVELVLDESRIMVGEPLHGSFRVHNRSAQTLWMVTGGDYRNRLGRPESYACTATDAHGTPAPSPDPGQTLGGLMWLQELPGGGHADKRLFIPNWARFSAPGTYRITCRTTLRVTENNELDDPDARALPVSASASLEVIPADRDAMGAMIASLAERMVDGTHERMDEAIQKLGAIADPRVIRYYIAMLSDIGRNASWVVDALARFDDDAALAGIRMAMNARADQVTSATTPEVAAQVAASIRHSAAVALSRSPHPDARDLLVSMHADPSQAVRITVLHQLGKEHAAASTALLREMARDPDPVVAGEARRYLDLRSTR